MVEAKVVGPVLFRKRHGLVRKKHQCVSWPSSFFKYNWIICALSSFVLRYSQKSLSGVYLVFVFVVAHPCCSTWWLIMNHITCVKLIYYMTINKIDSKKTCLDILKPASKSEACCRIKIVIIQEGNYHLILSPELSNPWTNMNDFRWINFQPIFDGTQ